MSKKPVARKKEHCCAKQVRRVVINGRRWKLDWSRPDTGDFGLCHYEKRRIQIDPGLDEVTTVSVLVDEIAHAHFIKLDNDFVDAFSDDVAKILQQCELIAEESSKD